MIQKLNKWDCIIDPIIKNNQQIGGLYLADIDCALSQDLLQQLQVGALLSVIDEPKVITSPSIIHQVINIPDCTEQNIQEFFPKTNEFIERHRYSFQHLYFDQLSFFQFYKYQKSKLKKVKFTVTYQCYGSLFCWYIQKCFCCYCLHYAKIQLGFLKNSQFSYCQKTTSKTKFRLCKITHLI